MPPNGITWIYRIVIGAVASGVFVVTYAAASVLAWLAEGIAGGDRMSSSGIAIALLLGQIASVALAALAAIGTILLGRTIRRRWARAHADRAGSDIAGTADR